MANLGVEVRNSLIIICYWKWWENLRVVLKNAITLWKSVVRRIKTAAADVPKVDPVGHSTYYFKKKWIIILIINNLVCSTEMWFGKDNVISETPKYWSFTMSRSQFMVSNAFKKS